MLARLSSSLLSVSWTPCPSSQPAQPVRPDWLSPLPPNLALSLPPSLPPSLAVCPIARKAFPTLPPKPSPQSRRYLLSLSLLRCLIPPFPNTISNLFSLSTPPALDEARPTRRCTALDFTHLRLARCILHPRLHSNSILRSAPVHPPISTLGFGPSIYTTHPRFTPSRARLAPPRPRALRLHDNSCSDDDALSPGLVFSAEAPRPSDVSFVCHRVGGVLWVST